MGQVVWGMNGTRSKCAHESTALKHGADGVTLFEVCEFCGKILRQVEQCDTCGAAVDPNADACASCS